MHVQEVKLKIEAAIKRVAFEQEHGVPELTSELDIIDDLGFSSLGIVALVAELEDTFGFNPFSSDEFDISNVKTVSDLCDIYARYFFK